MRAELALRKRDRAITRVIDAFGSVRSWGGTSAELNERIIRIKEEELAGCPVRMRTYVDGYVAALTAQLYRDDLVYGIWNGLTFYSVHRNREDYYEKHITVREFAELSDRYEGTRNKGHFWSHKPDKPFFVDAMYTGVSR
jgi:hypothetical protein